MAFDAGGVASGPMTNTLLLGLGIGLSAGIGGQDAAIYGLGMVALVAAAPLVSVMILGILMRIKVNRERRI
jgi:predicted MFS family arabinose efflux permease